MGSKYNPARHEVLRTVDGEADGLVVEHIRGGILDAEGDVLRLVPLTVLHTRNTQ